MRQLLISLVLSAIIATSLCGCATQQNPNQSNSNNPGHSESIGGDSTPASTEENVSPSTSPVETPTESRTNSTTPTENTTMNHYIGSWAEEWTHWSCGGMILDISISDGNIVLDCKYYSPAPDSFIASFSKEVPLSSISDNCLTISFDDDGWYHSGKVTIDFSEDSILCLVYGLDFFGEGWTSWGFDTGEFTLYKNNQIHEDMEYSQEDYDNLYGNGQTDVTSPQAEPSIPTLSYPDTNKIKSDLIAAGGNIFTIHYESLALDVTSIEIVRRRSDAEYDEVYLSVVLENDYYVVDAEYSLYYSYYDVGGWCLDQCYTTYHQSRAKANPVSDVDFVLSMQNHFSSCTITNRVQEISNTGVFTDTVWFDATLEQPYITTHFSGWFVMEFTDDYWNETYDFEIVQNDWSALTGEFRYRNTSLNMGAGFYSADVMIDISSINQLNDSELQITYSASVYLFDKDGYEEVNEEIPEKTATMRVYSEKVTILGKTIAIPRSAEYISMPWYGTFAIFLDHEDGVNATNNTAIGNAFAHFDKVTSLDDLQDAMDKLEGLNP